MCTVASTEVHHREIVIKIKIGSLAVRKCSDTSDLCKFAMDMLNISCVVYLATINKYMSKAKLIYSSVIIPVPQAALEGTYNNRLKPRVSMSSGVSL